MKRRRDNRGKRWGRLPPKDPTPQTTAPSYPSSEEEVSVGRWWLLAIFFVALAYRGVCFWVAGAHPLLRYPVVDAGYHDAWAVRMAAGDWLGHGPDDVFKPPLYPGFVAVMYWLFGRHIWLVQSSQHVLGAFSCVLLAIIGARLLGRTAGRTAGLIAALYAPYVFFEMQLLTPAVSLVLNLAAILLLLPRERKPGFGRLAAAGLLFGLSAGVRPDVLLPALLILALLIIENRRMPWRRVAGGTLAVLLGVAIVLVPIVLRNYHLTRQFIPVSSNAGVNFYVGNSTGADGITAVPVGLRWERLVARVPQEVLEKPATASRWWMRAARQEMAADPAAAAWRLGKKALAMFNRREFRNNICYHFFTQRVCWPLQVSPFHFATILPLAVCGLAWLWRGGSARQGRALVLCVLWVAGYWAAGVGFFVTARFRLPATPLLILPAAWGLVRIGQAVYQRQGRILLTFALVVPGVGVLCWPAWFGTPQSGWVRDYVNLGNSLSDAGDRQGAQEACRRALELQPQDPDAHFLLGQMLMPHDPREALKHLNAARRAIPDAPSLLLTIGQAYLQTGNAARAGRTLNELLGLQQRMNLWPKRAAWAKAHIRLAEIEPLEAQAHWQQAWSIDPRTAAEAAFLKRRELARVLKTFRAEARDKPWDWYSQANLGMALTASGRADEAVAVFRRAARLAPEREGLRFQLARALLQTGRKQEAVEILDRLFEELPDCGLRVQVEALRDAVKDQE